MSNKPILPKLSQISITALKLTPEVQAELRDAGIFTVGNLFRATEPQQTLIREHLTRVGKQELVLKTTRFYRTYRRVKVLLEKSEEIENELLMAEPASKDKQSANWEVDYHRIPIDVLGLSNQTYNALKQLSITRVGQVIVLLEDDNNSLREIKSSQQLEIRKKLASFLERPKVLQERLIQKFDEPPDSKESVTAKPIVPKSAKLPRPNLELSTPSDLERWSLDNLQIPRKALTNLRRFGIKTVTEVAAMTDAELGQFNAFGPATIASVRKQIRELQKKFGQQTLMVKPDQADGPNYERQYSKIQIDALGLSTQAYRALYHGGIQSLDQLLALSYRDLLKIRNLGPDLADEIKEKLGIYFEEPLSQARPTLRRDQKATADLLLQATIDVLKLEPRISNVLYRARVKTVAELIAMNETDLELLPGLGNVGLGKIQSSLNAFFGETNLENKSKPTFLLLLIADLPEVLDNWFTLLLTPTQRQVIEQRYGLFKIGLTLEKLGQQLGLSRQWVVEIQMAAVEKLQRNPSPIALLINLAQEGLKASQGILPSETWTELLAQQSFSIGSIRPEGILELLAEFEETWICYNIIGQTVLFSEVSTQIQAEEMLEEWQKTQAPVPVVVAETEPLISASAPSTAEETLEKGQDQNVGHPQTQSTLLESADLEDAPMLNTRASIVENIAEKSQDQILIKFVPDEETVLRNLRQWNRDLKTEAGQDAWGRRTVTYFVYDPRSNDFAPSKFCAYALEESWDREKRQLTIPIYTQIEPENPIFDGQLARRHLTNKLNFEPTIPQPDTDLKRAFHAWVKIHENNINVHSAGPQILVPNITSVALPVPTAAERPVPKPSRPRTKMVITTELEAPRRPRMATVEKVSKRNLFYEIEMELREQLGKVDLIGELAVNREQFLNWCLQIQSATWNNEPIQPKRIPAAFFVTLMVFAARYSEEDARNFWQPYAQTVWARRKAGPYFQKQCRERFKSAISFLAQECELFFPQRTEGDLVRPVYHHAIIPAYLERDFVNWLKRHWREILETPEGFLIPKLRQEKSLTYLPPTLKNFITKGETAETAAALIRNMATAASLYVEGESLAEIHDLLAGNPIEQTLWDELSQVFTEPADSGRRQHQRHRLEWLWNLEQNEMELRLRNLLLKQDAAPYQIVWVEKDIPNSEAAFADLYETLDPWQIEDEWLIDEVNFAAEGPLDGYLIILDDNDQVLWQAPVPPLPNNPAQFFRLTQQQLYAIPVSSDAIKSGQYLVALQIDVQLINATKEPITALESRTLPYLFRNEFNSVALYELTLPLAIVQNGTELESLTGSGSTSTRRPPFIYGEKVVVGLSRRVPPLYSSQDIWLIIPEISERILEQAAVEVRPQKGKLRRQLINELDNEVDEAGALWVPLQSLIGVNGGTYTLEVRRGLRSLLQAPLQFSVIPGIEIQPPSPQPHDGQIYTPNNPPSALLHGVEPAQIGNQERLTVSKVNDGWTQVIWNDLRGGCRLPILINNQQVPLEWPVERFFAWVDPTLEEGILTQDKLSDATLQAVATPKIAKFFSVSIGYDGQARQLPLDRHGRFRTQIGQDQLFDILRHKEGAQIQVYAKIFNEQWPLFTLQRYPEIQNISVAYDSSQKVLKFANSLKGAWTGNFRFQLHLISNPTAPPRILQDVQHLESQHLFSVDLTDGAYLFEVWDPNREQAVTKKMFGVGAVTLFGEALNLLESLSRGTTLRMPRWLANDMIHFLVAETDRNEEGVSILAPQWLWQLALLQPRAYEGVSDEELLALWPPLLAFRKIHNLDEWENKNGLLPDWAVMPAQLELKFERFNIPITIEPELVSRQGKHGIGHSLLKLGNENVEEYVYVSWEPYYREFVKVTLGIPDKSPGESDYTKIDILDIGSVYQCQQCGRFVKSILSEEVRQKHSHRLSQPQFKDVLNHPDAYQLLAEVVPKRIDMVRNYRQAPEFFIDRDKILTWFQNPDKLPFDYPSIEFSLARYAYLYASQKWVRRYHLNSQTSRDLDHLMANTKWRNGFDRLAYSLTETKGVSVPAWGAIGRFLAAFERRRDETVLDLDWYALLLALMARTITHNRSHIAKLNQQTNFRETDLAEILAIMNHHCPELLTWAFTWVEVFFIHSAA